MGAGKTSVGARLAARRGRLFVDSDAQLTARMHRTAADIVHEQGPAELHAGEDAAATDRLDRARRAGYEAVADLVVDVDGREPEDIAAEIEHALT